MTIFTKKITFTNVKIAYGGCDEQPVENHAKITFGSNVVDFDSIEE